MQVSTSSAKQVAAAMVAVALVATALSVGPLGLVGAQDRNNTTAENTTTEVGMEIDHITIEPVPSTVSVGNATELNVTFRDASGTILDITRNVTLTTDLGVFNESGSDMITIATSASHEGSPAHGHTYLVSENAGTATVQAESQEVTGSATVTFVDNATEDDADSDGKAKSGDTTTETTTPTGTDGDDGDGKAKAGTTTEDDDTQDRSDSGGKAKQPGNGDDDATDGGNGKAKTGDSDDGADTQDGGNGKAKQD